MDTASHAPPPAEPQQRVIKVRRDYNAWVASETLEDYALRYTPRSFRKWSEWRVGNTAFGSLSFLALEAIGGAIAINYGFANAMWAILVVGLVISIFQAATQINEPTVAFIAKAVALAVALAAMGSLLLGKLVDYTIALFQRIPALVG